MTADTVLLDVDGTLIDSTYLHALAWQRSFARFGFHPAWWHVHRAIGMGGDKLVEQVCGNTAEAEFGDDLRSAWAQQYRDLIDEVRPIDGAADFVRSLKGHGWRVALASSGAQEFTDHSMQLLGLTGEDVDAVTSSDDADDSKPAPDILGVALERSGGRRPIVIGDSTWDARSAERLGAQCIGVRTGGVSTEELTAAGCVAVHDSVAQIPDTVLCLDERSG